ncbi:hypothetical protein FA95DRAFT_1326180 [Auriscalpium vulgare]|uniref:Uncharacterized protein n=1 Tax=Auriscalpium vulgare TaxID=40419 RepID=A0ACB8S962_9AGAM|nr:hypothetical protein FA95DRAFT_1326180 [Auriscalpium vulgare]
MPAPNNQRDAVESRGRKVLGTSTLTSISPGATGQQARGPRSGRGRTGRPLSPRAPTASLASAQYAWRQGHETDHSTTHLRPASTYLGASRVTSEGPRRQECLARPAGGAPASRYPKVRQGGPKHRARRPRWQAEAGCKQVQMQMPSRHRRLSAVLISRQSESTRPRHQRHVLAHAAPQLPRRPPSVLHRSPRRPDQGRASPRRLRQRARLLCGPAPADNTLRPPAPPARPPAPARRTRLAAHPLVPRLRQPLPCALVDPRAPPGRRRPAAGPVRRACALYACPVCPVRTQLITGGVLVPLCRRARRLSRAP